MRISLTPNLLSLEDLKLEADPRLLPINPKTKYAQGKLNFSWMRYS